jgi:hypothetical protein
LKDNAPQRDNNQAWQKLVEREEKLSPFVKRILIVDDDPDTTFTFKKVFEEANPNWR